MSEYQHLISKYHWKDRENFIKLSADSGQKRKCGIGQKSFTLCFNGKLDFPNFNQRSSKVA